MSIQYDKLLAVGKEELIKKIKAGEVVVPIKGKERDDFLKFASLDPNSEGRKAFYQPTEEPKADVSALSQGGPVAKAEPSNTDIPMPTKEPESIADDWMGHESKDKLLESYKNLQLSVQKQKEIIDRHSADGGRAGRELKEAKAKLEKMQAEMSTRTSEPEASSIPVGKRPSHPSPDDFPEGMLDDGYTKALKSYFSDLDTYNSAREAEVSALRSELANIKPRIDEVHNMAESSARATRGDAVSKQWATLWDNDIPSFQKDFNLNTTVPVKQISDAWMTIGNTDTPADQKAASQAFLNSLPSSDLKAYEKIKKAVDTKYDFSDGVPSARYKTFRGALVESDLLDEYNVVKPVSTTSSDNRAAMERKERTQSESASVMPGGGLGRNDEKMDTMKPIAEELSEFRDLVKTWGNTPQSKMDEFSRTNSFKRMVLLGKKHGYKWPKSKQIEQALTS